MSGEVFYRDYSKLPADAKRPTPLRVCMSSGRGWANGRQGHGNGGT